VPQAQQGLRVLLVRPAHKDHKGLRGTTAPMEQPDRKAILARPDHKALRGRLASMALMVPKAQRARQAHRDQRVIRVTPV
jgi:hypothetical protein